MQSKAAQPETKPEPNLTLTAPVQFCSVALILSIYRFVKIFLVFEFGGLTQSCRLFLLSSKGIFINTYQLLSLLPDKSLAHLHTATLSIPVPFQEVRVDHTWSWPTVSLTSTHPAPHQHLYDTSRQNPGLRKSPSPPFPNFTISISENPFTEHKLLPSPAKPTLYLPSD